MIYGAFCCGRELPDAHPGDEYSCPTCRSAWTMQLADVQEDDEDDTFTWHKE